MEHLLIVVVINTYLVGFSLRIEAEAKRTTIIVDIFDIFQQVPDTVIHLKVDDEKITAYKYVLVLL